MNVPFLSLGDGFADPVQAARFEETTVRFHNRRALAEVGLDLDAESVVRHLGRLEPLPGNLQTPMALRYHGHQFRMYNPDLGDGRGFLYAQLQDEDGRWLDLGTKGSGTTPYSRGGDGRLTLKGGFREVLAAELLEARGVPTCRIASLIETHEDLHRYDEPSPTRSAVMVRLSWSHVRIGTFQRLAFHEQADHIRELLAYCERTLGLPSEPVEFLAEVSARLADTAAAWMVAGYVHGVLNTDNLNVTGESFDYGPFRWLIGVDPTFTAAYFDGPGLYAFGRQAGQVEWALYRLADALSRVADKASLKAALGDFRSVYRERLADRFCQRLRIARGDNDPRLIAAATTSLEVTGVPFDQFFHDWAGGLASAQRAAEGPFADAWRHPTFERVKRELTARRPTDALDHPHLARPVPCGLPYEEIESIWTDIDVADDWGAFVAKIADIRESG